MPHSPPSHHPTPRWRAVLFGSAALVAFAWPAALGRDVVVGDPLGEADNHLWMFWRAAQALAGAGPVANGPAGLPIPLMDPVNLPIYLVGAVAGPTWGWSLLVVFNVALALAGGWWLARQFGGETAALVGMVATGTAPFLAGVLGFGITESWPLGWPALHAAFLLRHAREGRPREAWLAGLALGAAGLSGWYTAFFCLVLEAMLVPALWWRYRRPGTVLQGLVGLVMVAPALARFLAVRSFWQHRWTRPAPGPPGPRDDWAELPVYGTDLLNLALPHPHPVHPPKVAYLGAVVLILALIGLWRHRRRAGPLLLLALPFLLLAVGYWPTVGGRALGVPGPAYAVVKLLPTMAGLSHWERAVGAAVPFVAAAAGVGAEALPRRLGPWLAVLVLLDGIAFAPAAWPRAAYHIDVPAVFAGLPPGGVVQIPFDNGRQPFSEEPARLYNRWQLGHGHPVSENYEGVDAVLAESSLVAAADAACGLKWTLPAHQKPPRMRERPAPRGEALAREIADLQDWGYAAVVLHRDRCPRPEPAMALLEAALGPGEVHPGGDVAWTLEGR